MHTENDTATRDNTLALWGAKHHSPTYYHVRTLIVAIPLVGGLIWNMV